MFYLTCRYISDHIHDQEYRAYCQMKLLECTEFARDYSPTYLEWVASSLCSNMALEVNFSDSKSFDEFKSDY